MLAKLEQQARHAVHTRISRGHNSDRFALFCRLNRRFAARKTSRVMPDSMRSLPAMRFSIKSRYRP